MAGPYEREIDTYDEPMPRAVHELHTAGRVRSGDPENLVRDTTMGYLTAACRDAGIELGEFDRQTLLRLADLESAAAQAVIGLITRAHAAGRTVPA